MTYFVYAVSRGKFIFLGQSSKDSAEDAFYELYGPGSSAWLNPDKVVLCDGAKVVVDAFYFS